MVDCPSEWMPIGDPDYSLDVDCLVKEDVVIPVNTTEITNADSPYAVLNTDDFISVDASGGDVVVVLLPLANVSTPVSIKKIDATVSVITIATNGSEEIDGSTTQTISSQYNALQLIPFTSEWRLY